jgi:hypothetical protein
LSVHTTNEFIAVGFIAFPVFLQFVIREPHQRAITLATRDARPHATSLIDRDAAGSPMLRGAQLAHLTLNLTLKQHHNPTLTYQRFLLAVATRVIDHCLGVHRRVLRYVSINLDDF